ALLGKELGEGRPDLPRYVSISPFTFAGYGPGFLGPQYGPLPVGGRGGLGGGTGAPLGVPPVEEVEPPSKGRGPQVGNAGAKAFDLAEEKPAVHDAYGRGRFGQGCLLARRLIEAGVPVVEVTMPGWDTHQDNFTLVEKLSGQLDAGWSALLNDLRARKRLD